MKAIKESLQNLFSIDLRALAAVRVFIGLIIIVDFIDRLKDVEIFYTNQGIIPLSRFIEFDIASSSFSLNALNGNEWFQVLLFIAAIIFAILLIIGYKTKFSLLMCWILVLSVQMRNTILLQGGDDYLRIILFWLLFLPVERKFSVDSFINGYKFENKYRSIASLAYLLQVASLYFFAAFEKSSPIWNTDYTAVYYTLSLEIFTTNIGKFLLSLKPLHHLFTFSVYNFEKFVAVLLFLPVKIFIFRTLAVLGILALHIGLGSAMELGIFPWIGIAAVIGIIPTETVDWIIKRLSINIGSLIIIYNSSNKTFIRFAKTFLILREVELIEGKNLIVARGGKKYFRYDAFKEIIKNSLIFKHIFLIFEFKIIKEILVQINKFIKNLDIYESKNIDNVFKLIRRTTIEFVVFILMFWIILYNLNNISFKFELSRFAQDVINFLRIDQRWAMFAPAPFTEDGWFIVKGHTHGGNAFYLYGANEITTEEKKPNDIANTHPNEKWRKFINNLWLDQYKRYREFYSDYICRKWNESQKPDKLNKIELIYMLERTLPNYEIAPVEKVLLSEYTCVF